MTDLSALKKQTLDALNAKSADMANLNNKVTALSVTINTMNAQITAMNATITGLANNLATAIKTHNADLAELLAAIGSLPAPVTVPDVQIVPAVTPEGVAAPPKAQGNGRKDK